MKYSAQCLLLALLGLAASALALVACGGGDANGDKTGRLVERLLASGQDEDTQVSTFVGELPAGLPWEIPLYSRSEVLGSFVLEQPEASIYVIMLDSDDVAAQILEFYEEALDQDPWQVEGFISSPQIRALQFGKIDDANVAGSLAVDSLPEGGSSVVISVQTIEEDGSPEEESFQLEASRPLPSHFPSEVPLYPGSTVIEASWMRSPGEVEFFVTLLTMDTQEDVVDFYREEFAERGFVVTEETGAGFVLVLSFADAATGELEGSVTADIFEEDPAYTRVDIQARVGSDQPSGD